MQLVAARAEKSAKGVSEPGRPQSLRGSAVPIAWNIATHFIGKFERLAGRCGLMFSFFGDLPQLWANFAKDTRFRWI